jgi:hypothetical protein
VPDRAELLVSWRDVPEDERVCRHFVDLSTLPYYRSVAAVILGCTEIPFTLLEVDTDLTLINQTQFLAEATMRATME